MAARPAFLLFVDVRFPGEVPLADGMFPAYTQALGAVPVMNVAFRDAWNWQREGAVAARLCVEGGMRDSESHNVIAELPGSDPSAGILALGAHHDTQAGSPGADDNASGVAGLVELARVLAPLPRRRTIRLISFGAEEQLSMGSAAYVRAHRAEVAARFRLMFNLDSIGSGLGWTEIWCNGPPELVSTVRPWFEKRSLYPSMQDGLVPYADHFPFVAAGVPGVWIWRRNCENGRFFHHRPDDDMSRVSPAVMARHLDAIAAGMGALAQAVELPFPAGIPEKQKEAVAAMWSDLFGGW
jgi:aminopeptidase YwaD